MLQLQPHEKDLGGGFKVRRLLPAAQRQSIGPFVFFDHFGPVEVVPGEGFDVRPHPHIGLATVTYLFEGAMMHRDSLGCVQKIEPGAINWMTAGRGIVHSERAPPDMAATRYTNHGLQLWAALPLEYEETEPAFVHTPARAIPEVDVGQANVHVLIGQAFGVTSPVTTFAPTLYLDIALPAGASVELPPLADELALYTVNAEIQADGQLLPSHTLTVLPALQVVRMTTAKDARIAVIGGAAMDSARHIWWNFVSSRKERIAQAAQDWETGRFGQVPGEHESIPLPATRFLNR